MSDWTGTATAGAVFFVIACVLWVCFIIGISNGGGSLTGASAFVAFIFSWIAVGYLASCDNNGWFSRADDPACANR